MSITDDGELVLVDTECRSPSALSWGSLEVEGVGRISWMRVEPAASRFVVVTDDSSSVILGADPPGLRLDTIPPSAELTVGGSHPSFEFKLGELDPAVVLTPDGPRPVEDFSGPCLRGGSDWWGVQLLGDGHLEVVSLICEPLLAGGFVVTVDEQPRLTWLSGFVDDLLNKGVEEPEGDLESVQALELSPETNSATPAPPVEAYDFSGLPPEARIRVEQLGGYFVLVQRGDLQEGTVVTGVGSVPRDEVERRCEAATDGSGDGSGTSE